MISQKVNMQRQLSKLLILYPSKDTYNYVGYDDDYYCQLFAHYKC